MAPDGRYVYAVSYSEKGLCRWDLATGALERWKLRIRPTAVEITADGEQLVLASLGRLEVWGRQP